MVRRRMFLHWLMVACSVVMCVSASYAKDDEHREASLAKGRKLFTSDVQLRYNPVPEHQINGYDPFAIRDAEKATDLQAESLENRVQDPVKKIEAKRTGAKYEVIFVIPSPDGKPIPLDKDPNLFLSAIVHEITELKVPKSRIKSLVDYSASVKRPQIAVYCSNC